MKNKINILLTASLIFFIGLFVIFLFKNIQYPLMWGDEAETALYAGRVLDFGYPKIHKGEETYKLVMVSGDVGVNKKYDANTTSLWGQYYFGAIGEYFARFTDDNYLKTAYLRIPFALIGLLGIIILPLSLLAFIKRDNKSKIILLIIYFFMQILSISLILHMREVRSYSLSIFLSSSVLFVFITYYFRKGISGLNYLILQSLLFILLFNSFPPGYMALAVPIGLYAFINNFLTHQKESGLIQKLAKMLRGNILIIVAPIIISGLLALPVINFFETSKYSANAYADIGYSINTYLLYVARIFIFLLKHHYLALALFIKCVSVYFYRKHFLHKVDDHASYIRSLLKISDFLYYLLTSYALLICITPFLFDRYFVFLQPLLSVMIILDLYINHKILDGLSIKKESRSNMLLVYYFFALFIFLIISMFKFDTISGYFYQMRHRYIGPMDEIVSYINSKYSNTEKLVIDTEIEQPVLIYYLGSKVLCDDINECFKIPPDIIIPRQALLSEAFIARSEKYMNKEEYERILLPILDYPSNNIPELSLNLRHLFKTPYTENDNEKIIIFIKK